MCTHTHQSVVHYKITNNDTVTTNGSLKAMQSDRTSRHRSAHGPESFPVMVRAALSDGEKNVREIYDYISNRYHSFISTFDSPIVWRNGVRSALSRSWMFERDVDTRKWHITRQPITKARRAERRFMATTNATSTTLSCHAMDRILLSMGSEELEQLTPMQRYVYKLHRDKTFMANTLLKRDNHVDSTW